MRLKKEYKDFICSYLNSKLDNYQLYLFGSRTDDSQKGGDIDLLILTNQKLDRKSKSDFRISFYKEFGWQKVDLVNFTFNEKHPFKEIILKQSVELS